MSLSENQKLAISILKRAPEWSSANRLGIKMKTLLSLHKRELVEYRWSSGARGDPNICMDWRLTRRGLKIDRA